LIISESDAVNLVSTIMKHTVSTDAILSNLKTAISQGELEQNSLGGFPLPNSLFAIEHMACFGTPCSNCLVVHSSKNDFVSFRISGMITVDI